MRGETYIIGVLLQQSGLALAHTREVAADLREAFLCYNDTTSVLSPPQPHQHPPNTEHIPWEARPVWFAIFSEDVRCKEAAQTGSHEVL